MQDAAGIAVISVAYSRTAAPWLTRSFARAGRRPPDLRAIIVADILRFFAC